MAFDFDLAVVVPCSKTKRHCPIPLATADELKADRCAAHARLAAFSTAARDLYVGRQHRAMVRAVDGFRSARPELRVGLFVVSAGYGLLGENERIVPYEAQLGSNQRAWRDWGVSLGLPTTVAALADRAGEIVFALSAAYMTAAGLPSARLPDAIYLAGADFTSKHPDAYFVLAGRSEARRFGRAERDVRAVVLDQLLQSSRVLWPYR